MTLLLKQLALWLTLCYNARAATALSTVQPVATTISRPARMTLPRFGQRKRG